MNLVRKNSSYKKRNRVFAITFNTLLVCGVCISFMHYNTFNKASAQDETVKSIEENDDELYIEQTGDSDITYDIIGDGDDYSLIADYINLRLNK